MVQNVNNQFNLCASSMSTKLICVFILNKIEIDAVPLKRAEKKIKANSCSTSSEQHRSAFRLTNSHIVWI